MPRLGLDLVCVGGSLGFAAALLSSMPLFVAIETDAVRLVGLVWLQLNLARPFCISLSASIQSFIASSWGRASSVGSIMASTYLL